jgi:Fic family protein
MVKLKARTIKGKEYAYLEKSVRIGKTTRKVAHYIGPNKNLTKWKIAEEEKKFNENLLEKTLQVKIKFIEKSLNKPESPIEFKDIKTIEEMNLIYKKIVRSLHPKDIEDINKRFVANYVFESNALEGNSLTLKNVAEVVFENRISKGKDLREIYDAKNSYNAFLFLQKKREKINHKLIKKIHSLVLENIDDRLGYRKVPIMLLGKPNAKLSKPENVEHDMEKLLEWYEENINKIHVLELAFKFHAKFEKIHPFCDGNGRVGRLLLNYILMKHGYFPIIIRNTHRNSYIKALEAADRGKWIVLMRFALKYYKATFRKFFLVYEKYSKN